MATAADAPRHVDLPPAADWRVLGRLTQASNATLLVRIEGVRYVYKPVIGESPLWDFPRGTLGHREVAVFRLATALGWDLLPPTRWVEDGPHGAGMLQQWVDAEDSPVALFPEGGVPSGWVPVMRGVDEHDEEVVLAHEDSPQLRRMVVFDAVVNNADRKGGHLLIRADGTVVGIDHGLCLNSQHKLRTVLWGFAGQDVPADLLADLEAAQPDFAAALDGFPQHELDALRHRTHRLLTRAVFPRPSSRGPVIPWPPL